jgi:uncharacterized protein YjdB
MYSGQFVGTRGSGLRLEGFTIYLVGFWSKYYNIYYQCHVQNLGDSRVYKSGEFCGTRGQSKRVEAMKVWIA